MSFLEQFDKSKQNVAEMKLSAPHLFPQWVRLQNAKEALQLAIAEHEAALAEWEKL